MTRIPLRDTRAWTAAGLGLAALLVATLQLGLGELAAARDELAVLSARGMELRERLSEAGATGETTGFAPEDLWTSEGETTPEQRLQSFALDSLETYGQTLLRYEQANLSQPTTTPSLALQLEVQGPLEGLVRFLQDVRAHQPRLAVETLVLRGLPDYEQNQDGATLVASHIVLWGFTDVAPR